MSEFESQVPHTSDPNVSGLNDRKLGMTSAGSWWMELRPATPPVEGADAGDTGEPDPDPGQTSQE